MESLRETLEWLRPHINFLALLLTWVGIGVVYFRRRRNWRRKQFLTQVNFSLNYVQDSMLTMRTLLETTASDVWLNEHGVRKVYAAAQKATIEHPFVVLRDGKDRDFANRAVLNVLSERFADTFLALSLGVPVKTANFCFAITFEKYEEMRTLKLRVLLMEERTLVELFGPGGTGSKLQLPHPVYRARLATLRAMYEQYVRDQGADHPVLGTVELGVRA